MQPIEKPLYSVYRRCGFYGAHKKIRGGGNRNPATKTGAMVGAGFLDMVPMLEAIGEPAGLDGMKQNTTLGKAL